MRDLLMVMLVGLTYPQRQAVCVAQEPPRRSAGITGQVQDAAGGQLKRANVCAQGERRHVLACVMADTAGLFRIDSLYPDSYILQIECETKSRGYSGIVGQQRVEAMAQAVATADIKVPSSGCDQRPFDVVRGEIAGHWASGFELDDFVPCQDTTKHAWVERQGLRLGELWTLPAGEEYGAGTRWFVRWRGVLIGPRGFTKRYRMVVEDVVEMRVPKAGDCRS